MDNCCSNLYFLSTVACKLANCLTEDELAILSADLTTLSDMLASIMARKDCEGKD
jgi:hypothetical protein